MAGLKEIRSRIKSVQNTKKTTYAMKLVSAAKLRRAQDAVTRSRAYTEGLKNLLAKLSLEGGIQEAVHPLMMPRDEVKKVKVFVVGASRGLCGAYNSNVFKRIEKVFGDIRAQYPGASIDGMLLGRKPGEYFRRRGFSYSKSVEDLPDDAGKWPVEELCREVEQEFLKGQVDRVILIYTRFKSALSMTVEAETLLPMEAPRSHQVAGSHQGGGSSQGAPASSASGVTLFEPSPALVFEALMPRIMRSRVRQAALDAKASEHASRMTAMDAATKNAGDLIQSLTSNLNKRRQAAVTNQLLDIVGGAEGLK